MDKKEILHLLNQNHQRYKDYILGLTDTELTGAPAGKWSPAQQFDHIRRSVAPLNLAFTLPLFVLRIIFGVANRPSKSFEALVEKYKSKLQTGGRAGKAFIPDDIREADKSALIKKYSNTTNKLSRLVEKISEKDLDTFILPHPLLGKLTLREMLYFTIHHAEHHLGTSMTIVHSQKDAAT